MNGNRKKPNGRPREYFDNPEKTDPLIAGRPTGDIIAKGWDLLSYTDKIQARAIAKRILKFRINSA